MINLISDTVTKPTPEMLQAMMEAEVGDDVFGQDPTVNKLEHYIAKLFAKEAALFCPSGTMTNQLAIKCHTQALDEVICDISSHVYQYESAGYAFHSGISVNLLNGINGKFTPEQLKSAIKPSFDWLPKSKLVVLENTCNKGGGSIYTLPEAQAIKAVCEAHDLKFHLDGARIFNALIETGENPSDWGKIFDSISICLSKGLGAPVGSLLLGDKDFIAQARRFRKVFGGGMRQAGYLAAAGLFALKNNITRLSKDNAKAKQIGQHLQTLSFVSDVRPVQSNIVIFDLAGDHQADIFLENIKAKGIHAVAFGPQTVRFTFHLEINDIDLEKVMTVLNNYKQ